MSVYPNLESLARVPSNCTVKVAALSVSLLWKKKESSLHPPGSTTKSFLSFSTISRGARVFECVKQKAALTTLTFLFLALLQNCYCAEVIRWVRLQRNASLWSSFFSWPTLFFEAHTFSVFFSVLFFVTSQQYADISKSLCLEGRKVHFASWCNLLLSPQMSSLS